MKAIALGVGALFSAAIITPAAAGPEEVEAVRALCRTQLNVPEAICDCLAGKAAAMTDAQQIFIVGTLQGDAAKVDSARGSLGPQETMAAATFMVSQPAACARGG